MINEPIDSFLPTISSALTAASHKLAELMYAQASKDNPDAGGGPAGGGPAGGDDGGQQNPKNDKGDDDVVDATESPADLVDDPPGRPVHGIAERNRSPP